MKPTRNTRTRAASVSVSSSSCLLAAGADAPADNPLDEPDPDAVARPDPEPRIPSEPDVIQAAEDRCEELFPLTGWSRFVKQACRDYGAGWVIEALDEGHTYDANSWTYIKRILERFRAAGMSNSEALTRNVIPLRATGTAGPIRETHQQKFDRQTKAFQKAVDSIPEDFETTQC